MIKKILLVGLILSSCVWADNDRQDNHNKDQHIEDEEIIGGIGGTGIHDMERPELLERPDIDLDIILDNDASMDPDLELEEMAPE